MWAGGHRFYKPSIPFFSLSRPAVVRAAQAKVKSHDARGQPRQSDNPNHLNRASAKARSAVNETRSRDKSARPLTTA
jgi:hypothetical protein